jgi:putative oxidoreductase
MHPSPSLTLPAPGKSLFWQRAPWLTLPQALLLLRVAVAIFFMAHAAVRLVNGSMPRFGLFLESRGLPWGLALVWGITLWELAAGTMMALGRCVRPCAAGLLAIAAGGIVLIHMHQGWFVGEHGVGGMEYSLSLIVALLVIMAADREPPQQG